MPGVLFVVGIPGGTTTDRADYTDELQEQELDDLRFVIREICVICG